MKKFRLATFIFLSVLFLLQLPTTAEAKAKKYVKKLSVSKTAVTITDGSNASFTATVKTKGKAKKGVTCKIADTSIATYNIKTEKNISTITIFPGKSGKTSMTITTEGKNKKKKKLSKTVEITVTSPEKPESVETPVATPTHAAIAMRDTSALPSESGVYSVTVDDRSGVYHSAVFNSVGEELKIAYVYFYDQVVVDEAVTNAAIINSFIDGQREAFFAEHNPAETAETMTLPTVAWDWVAFEGIYLSENYLSLRYLGYQWYGGTDQPFEVNYTFDLNTGKIRNICDVTGIKEADIHKTIDEAVKADSRFDGWTVDIQEGVDDLGFAIKSDGVYFRSWRLSRNITDIGEVKIADLPEEAVLYEEYDPDPGQYVRQDLL